MRGNKLTVFISLLASVFFLMNSCKPDAVISPPTTYSKRDIIMSSGQEIPSNSSTATGILNVSYSKVTKILTYDFTWSGLTGPATAAHIHGLGPVGYSAGVVQAFSGLSATASGKYSGTLLADGVKVIEDDLLNGLYYVNIHTATYAGGEIRGQVRFY